MKLFKWLIGVGSTACALSAYGQSVYVDLNVSGDYNGDGAPSSAFGGAAGAPGQWNAIPADSSSSISLFDTDGSSTGVSVSHLGGGGALGFYNHTDSGDVARLLNDAENVGDFVHFAITGLRAGTYRVYTFAVEPQGDAITTNVTVPGSLEGTMSVTGPLSGNQLVEGTQFSSHTIQLNAGPLMIDATGDPFRSYVNGFQIELIPEPTTASILVLGLAALAAMRRKRM